MKFVETINRLLKRGEIKGDYLLILDIGTEFVKSLVLRVDKNLGTGAVVGVGYEKQSPGNMQAGAVADINGVIETCHTAVERAKVSANIRRSSVISQVVLGIAGEFVRGAATTLNYERENPKNKIDLIELKNIIQKIQWRAFNKIKKEAAEEANISEIEIKLINAAIVDIKIDGYKIINPLNFQGKQVSISIFNAYAPLVHLGALQSIVEALKLELLFIAAEPYAIARAVNLANGGDDMVNDAIFIDIGGGTTDIAIVRNNDMEGIKSLALGGKAFTKRLAQVFDLGLREAEEIKLKYGKGEVSSIVKRKITSFFSQDIRVWLSGVRLILEEFSVLQILPSQILLCGGASLLPGLKGALEAEEWRRGLSFIQSPRVGFIRPENIINIKDETGELIDSRDITPLSLASLSLDLINKENSLMISILRRTIRLIQS